MSRIEQEQARKLGFARAEVARLDKVISEASDNRAVWMQALDEAEGEGPK